MSANEPNDLDMDVILNCILVNENVRPAMLVQPVDYKEASHEGPKTKYIIEEIKKNVPTFISKFRLRNISRCDYFKNSL